MEWNRRTRFLAVCSIALTVGVVGGWVLSRSSDDSGANLTNPTIGTNADNTGKPFNFVELEALDGSGNVVLEGADRNLVVNFWFSTCGPCKREMPALAAASAKYSGHVEFVGVNPNDNAESATAFLESYGVGYANYLDDGDQLEAAGVTTMPATFFVKNGRIAETHAGELTAEEIDDVVARVFGPAQ